MKDERSIGEYLSAPEAKAALAAAFDNLYANYRSPPEEPDIAAQVSRVIERLCQVAEEVDSSRLEIDDGLLVVLCYFDTLERTATFYVTGATDAIDF